MASCTTTLTWTSQEEPIRPSNYSTFPSNGVGPSLYRANAPRQRRRHSSYQASSPPVSTTASSFEHDDVQILLDRFLAEMSRRLDFLETYGHLKLDHGIERAYSTLHAVRDSCSHVSDEFIGAGRRRAKVFVETLEQRYKGALARKDTMEQKAYEGISMLESMLADFEARAYALRDSRFAATQDFFGEGWRRMDEAKNAAKEVVDDGIQKALEAKDQITAKIENAIKCAREQGLIHFHDLPEPWQGNPYIYKGYRFNQTAVECFRSILGVSNEMVNIWSHLIGFVVIIALGVYFYPSTVSFSNSSTADMIIAFIFLISAAKCLACSTLWHTMSSISSQEHMERFACVDYTGISLLVATSIMTTEYTAFYCEPVNRWIWMTITAGLGVVGTIMPWHPVFNGNDMAWLRVVFFVGLAMTGFFPVFQLAWTRGIDWAIYFYSPIMKSLLIYFSGAILYACKVPERWCPGMFDYFGGSHNIWHFAVLGGILFHYNAMQTFFVKAFEMAGPHCSVY